MKTRLLIALPLFSLSLVALRAQSPDPRFTNDGQLIRPDNYREWIYLSSGLGMTYGVVENTAGRERFDNVFVTPQAYKAFLQTGTWPDKTMFVPAMAGVVRTFSSFSEALREFEDARIYSGIHFRFADEDATDFGIKVAQYILANACLPLHGQKNGQLR